MDEIINKWSELDYQAEYNIKSDSFVIKKSYKYQKNKKHIFEILIDESNVSFEWYQISDDMPGVTIPLYESQIIDLSGRELDLIDLTREYFWRDLVIDIKASEEIPKTVDVITILGRKAKFTIKKVVKIKQLPDGSLTATVKGYFE